MAEKITGSWPGGPKREGPTQERSGPPRIKRVEDIEAGLADRSMRRRRSERQKRIWIGLALSMMIAGGVGWALGIRGHATIEEINAQRTAQQQRDADISTEVNRMMLELWRMEDVESARNRGRIR